MSQNPDFTNKDKYWEHKRKKKNKKKLSKKEKKRLKR